MRYFLGKSDEEERILTNFKRGLLDYDIAERDLYELVCNKHNFKREELVDPWLDWGIARPTILVLPDPIVEQEEEVYKPQKTIIRRGR